MLDYDLTMVKGVHFLDSDDNIVHVDCSSESDIHAVHVHALDLEKAHAQLHQSRYLVGHQNWGCSINQHDQSVEPILRRIDGVRIVGRKIALSTTPIKLYEVFQTSAIAMTIFPSENSLNFGVNYDKSTNSAIQHQIPITRPLWFGQFFCEECYYQHSGGVRFILNTTRLGDDFIYVNEMKSE